MIEQSLAEIKRDALVNGFEVEFTTSGNYYKMYCFKNKNGNYFELDRVIASLIPESVSATGLGEEMHKGRDCLTYSFMV